MVSQLKASRRVVNVIGLLCQRCARRSVSASGETGPDARRGAENQQPMRRS